MKIEFIIPTWGRPDSLMVMLSCLRAQTSPNWTARVIIDGITNDYFKVKETFQNDERISFTHMDQGSSDWGNTPRNFALDSATEDWIVMTGDDNYYVPAFVDIFLSTAKEYPNTDFFYCDMVHDRFLPGYQPVKSKIQEGFIDIGNFMVRRTAIGDLRLNAPSYTADYEFVRDFLNKSKKMIKINKVLYVHN